ncbi:RcpC/CpaB family pilus assembly protein [Pseudarthrobacter sp. PvP090]|uniref:Flp pilus assembly protein CpaB n=1 Tax=Pseudarthrobacter sp. PvP090 TaxID=3156393 RepID=UPI00339B5378
MKTRLLGGIAALIVAVIGTVLLVSYVQGADRRALANTETSEVYVVQKEIAAGTSAANFGDSVVKKTVPKSAVASDSVTTLAELGQKVSAVGLVPGEQLLATRMVEPAQLLSPGRAPVPSGLQEVTVKLSIDRIVGGSLKAGDTVGVILSYPENDKLNLPDQSQLVFHKVLVTAVQNSTGAVAQEQPATTNTESSSDGAMSSKSSAAQATGGYLVTLARPSIDVEKIVHAIEFGKVYLSKESESSTTDNTGVMERIRVFQ